MIDDTSAVFITVFGKGLNFAKKIYKGLINPNQCRSFGVQCVDNHNDPTRELEFYANNLFLTLHMQGTNCLVNSFFPYCDELRQFPHVFMSDETSLDPFILTYPTISAMSLTINEEAGPYGSRYTQTLFISNEAIETGINMYNIHYRIVKSVKINQE